LLAPDNIHFKHRLEGVDETWSDPTTERAVSYSRLPHGRYRFFVTACNRAGAWNLQGSSLTLNVAPFYWQTWWFRSGVVLLSALVLTGTVRFFSYRSLHRRLAVLQRETAVHQERVRIAKDIHDDLGASLTQIALLGELARDDRSQPEKLDAHIANIATTARSGVKSLEEIVWAVNPKNDTLAHLLGYIGQYAVDFLQSASVRCRIDFPEELPALTISSDTRHNLFLAAKEALNNVAKHAKATEVWLRATMADDTLRLMIQDNGCGFTQAAGGFAGNGLRNLKQRLAEIGGTCDAASTPSQGTRISIAVLIKN
jgi:signal transduction histidine kinase